MEEILALLWGIFIFIALIAILNKWGTNSDQLERRKKSISGKGSKQETVEELNTSFYARFFAPTINKIKEVFAKINEKENKNGKKNDSTKAAERQLRLAGMDMSAEAFMFYKNCFMAIVVIVAIFIAIILSDLDMMIRVIIALVGLVIALLVPNALLKAKASSRQEAIRVQVPDALDLLGVCIEAGLSFDSSLLKVSEKIQGPFIDELLIVYREINMGVPRNDALKKLADATEISELKTFVSALIQANQLGIPINNVMTVQSEQLRETRKQLAKEKGAKAPVKMLIPMVGLIFPVLFIILMGPTVLNIIDML